MHKICVLNRLIIILDSVDGLLYNHKHDFHVHFGSVICEKMAIDVKLRVCLYQLLEAYENKMAAAVSWFCLQKKKRHFFYFR